LQYILLMGLLVVNLMLAALIHLSARTDNIAMLVRERLICLPLCFHW